MTFPNPNPNPKTDLALHLRHLGLKAAAESINDFLARATKSQWSAHMVLEELIRMERTDRDHRSLQRRLQFSRIGRFKVIADFDWNWPKKIDRDIIHRALTLDFIKEGRNLILVGANQNQIEIGRAHV